VAKAAFQAAPKIHRNHRAAKQRLMQSAERRRIRNGATALAFLVAQTWRCRIERPRISSAAAR